MTSSTLTLSSVAELEPPRHGPGIDGGYKGLPFWDASSQLVNSIAANLLSRLPFSVNCRRDQGGGSGARSGLGASGFVCGSSSVSQYSSGTCTTVSAPPILFPFYHPLSGGNPRHDLSVASSAVRSLPTSVRVDGLGLGSNDGGPAFVGQVFSMCDPSGTGLMAVTTHFDIPFLSKRYSLFLMHQLQCSTIAAPLKFLSILSGSF